MKATVTRGNLGARPHTSTIGRLDAMRKRMPVLLAVVAALSWSFAPSTARPVAAVDCSQVFCGTLEIVPSNGAGSGRITSDPSGIDCSWTPAGRSGTCVYQFSWPHFVAGGIDVDLYLDPDGHSYVCQGQTCGGLDQTLHRVEHLDPGNDFDVFMVFNLGNKTTVSLSTAGTGAGRVTTSPAGLDCRVVAGVKSGTCSYDYWYLGNSYSVTLHRTPDTDSYACSSGAPFCGTPDTDYASTLNMSPGGSGPPASFWLAVPVTVQVTGSGTVTSDPGGISCPSTCSKWFPPDYAPDDFTKLAAAPAAGWYVKDWTGTACGATTGSTCTFFNGYAGASVGVVFARLSTPPPSATPKPSAKPTLRPSSTPSAAPTGIPTLAPGSATPTTSGPATAASASPEASTVQTAPPEGGPTEEPGVATDAVGSDQPGTPAATPAPVPSGSPAGPIDGTILVLLLVIAALILAIGFALGRRRSSA